MVDREARRQYAQLLRQFTSGRMTNVDYEKRFDSIHASADDPAVREAYYQIWMTCDDCYTHCMTDPHRLTGENRRSAARMVLFLLLAVSAGGSVAAPLLVCEVLLRFRMKRRMDAAGDTEVWPFLWREELAAAVRQPRLLNGMNWEEGRI